MVKPTPKIVAHITRNLEARTKDGRVSSKGNSRERKGRIEETLRFSSKSLSLNPWGPVHHTLFVRSSQPKMVRRSFGIVVYLHWALQAPSDRGQFSTFPHLVRPRWSLDLQSHESTTDDSTLSYENEYRMRLWPKRDQRVR